MMRIGDELYALKLTQPLVALRGVSIYQQIEIDSFCRFLLIEGLKYASLKLNAESMPLPGANTTTTTTTTNNNN